MTEQQRGLLEKAERALADAEALTKHGTPDGVINRAYYSAFYSASAALLLHDETPKTHSGTLTRFQFHFVKSGKIPPHVGRIFVEAFRLRSRSDYDAQTIFEAKPAEDLLEEVETFVQTLTTLLNAAEH